MINELSPHQTGPNSSMNLESDLGGGDPLYLYWPEDKSILLYSTSITELLNDVRLQKPLKVRGEGVSFLLQSGVIPPPRTAYQDIYILGIGDKAIITIINRKVEIKFINDFPFLNANRLMADEMLPDENLILQMLAEATISNIDEAKQTFLFHSAGKDSNSIALALAEAGWQNRVILISHKSKGKADESEISSKIAKKLGFKHKVLHEVDQLQVQHRHAITDFFDKAPFPCADNVTLAYPLYANQYPELKCANIVDGTGNDVYLGHIPAKREFMFEKLSRYLKSSRFLTKNLRSESLLNIAGRTRAEWTGLSGLSYKDAKLIWPNSSDVSGFWNAKDSDQDYLDFRALVRGTIIDQEIFVRKVRNFADSYNSNLILPWTNQKISKYFSNMPEIYLFDRNKLKNKLFIRAMLKQRMGLDSDSLGKMKFSYDLYSVVIQNWEWMMSEVLGCELWSDFGISKLTSRLKSIIDKNNMYSSIAIRLFYRIFILSLWYRSISNHKLL